MPVDSAKCATAYAPRRLAVWVLCGPLLATFTACSMAGSSSRWSPDQAVLPTADFQGNQVTVHNIRNCEYRSETDYTVRTYDKTIDLNSVRTVDFIVVPFRDFNPIAHTFLSFGFDNGEYLAVSVEIRKERADEEFNPVKGLFSEYELMYVVGDERDLIGLRANFRREDVYVYRSKAKPEEAQALFVDMLQRADKLAVRPEKYNLISNNCTTNVRRHINRLSHEVVPYNVEVLLPGYSDRLAYELGLIETNGDFAQTRAEARVNPAAYMYRDRPDFSQLIRQASAETSVARSLPPIDGVQR